MVPYAPTRIRTRPLHLIRALRAQGHDVTVATLWVDALERDALDELARDVNGLVAEHMPIARSLWNCLRTLPGSDPLQAHFSWSPRLAARLQQLVDTSRFDVVHVEHLRGVRYGLMLNRMLATRVGRPALVWDSVDCISHLFRRTSTESQMPRARLAARLELGRTERFEGSATTAFDRVLVTSDADRHELLQLTRAATSSPREPCVDVVPNGVDLDYFSPTDGPREPMTLVVTGKMSYHANATAAVWFVRQVMPAVWAVHPSARVWIVGKDPGREVQKLGQSWGGSLRQEHANGRAVKGDVLVTGTVPDVRPFLRRAALAIAPIQYGVGIQNKVLEAMACGTPVVATAEAVAGLRARPGTEVAAASSPTELAIRIIDLLNDPARRADLGRAGRRFIERDHDWRRICARLTDIYRHART